MSHWLTFKDRGPSVSGKTRRFLVHRTDPPFVVLGEIKWFGRWRCYAYFPERDLVFEKDCLRDIAAFCERETRRQRSRKKP